MPFDTRSRVGSLPAIAIALLVCWTTTASPTSAQGPPSAAQYKAYTLQHAKVEQIETTLRKLIVDHVDPSANITANTATNEILVRGSAQAQKTAKDLIDSLDQPSHRPNPAQGANAAPPPAAAPMVNANKQFTRYTCRPEEAEIFAERLKSMFESRGDVHLMPSMEGKGEIYVVAPPDAHLIVQRTLAQWREQPPTEAPSPLASSPPMNNTRPATMRPSPSGPAIASLRSSSPTEIEASLRQLLGRRLESSTDPITGVTAFRFVSQKGVGVTMQFAPSGDAVIISGDPSLSGQMQRLVEYIDRSRTQSDETIHILPLRQADPEKVRAAVEAYQNGYREPDKGSNKPNAPTNPQSLHRPPASRSTLRLAAALFGAPAPMIDTAVTPVAFYQDSEAGTATVAPDDEDTFNLAPDVTYEMLPDLDVVIVRGSDAATGRLVEIIDLIERIAAETEPRIEIYPMKHIDCISATEVFARVYQALLGGRQGRVTVTPLVKPNALLMIGWGDAVEGAKELLNELDQPAAPEARFEVFFLRNAAAQYVAMTIQQMYPTPMPGSLAPRVRAFPDARINAVIVQAAPRDLIEIKALLQSLDAAKGEAVSRVLTIRLKNSLVADLVQVLREAITAASRGTPGGKLSVLELLSKDGDKEKIVESGLLSDVQVTGNPRTNTLIVTGPADSMPLIEELVKLLDQPSGVAQIKVFRVVNGDATALVTMLQDLIPSQIAGQPSAQLPGAEGEESLVPVRFAVDTRTNSIIAAGSEGDLFIIETLLFKLDAENLQTRRNIVYRLKNAPALAVAETINEFIRSRRTVQQAAPGVFSAYEQLESEVIVVPELVSNALVISAVPEYFDELIRIVEDLDAQPAQVSIQVLIAEVSLDDTEEFGVEMGLQDSILFDRGVISNNIITPGFAFNNQSLGNSSSADSLATRDLVGTQGLADLGVSRINSELGFGGFVFSASSESVSVLIRALQECRRLTVLSRPQVTTLDNQSAFIQVGKRVPRIAQQNVNNSGRVTNAIVLENVGLILAVTPRISPDGKVVMEVDAEKSALDPIADGVPISFSDTGDPILSPSISVATAQTTVSACDGETIVIGGLIATRKSTAHRQVPLLGDIPIVRHLFSYDSEINERTELLIILTPTIMNDPLKREIYKQSEMARMHWCLSDVQNLQGDIGSYDIEAMTPAAGDIPMLEPDAVDLRNAVPLEQVPMPPGSIRSNPPAPGPEANDGARSQPTLAPPMGQSLPTSNDFSQDNSRWNAWGGEATADYNTTVSYGGDRPASLRNRVDRMNNAIAAGAGVMSNAAYAPPGVTVSPPMATGEAMTQVSSYDPRLGQGRAGGVTYGTTAPTYVRVPLRDRYAEAMQRTQPRPYASASGGVQPAEFRASDSRYGGVAYPESR